MVHDKAFKLIIILIKLSGMGYKCLKNVLYVKLKKSDFVILGSRFEMGSKLSGVAREL